MMSFKINFGIFVCFQAFLIQCALSQVMPGQFYNGGVELEVEAISRGNALNGLRSNIGPGRVGLGNAGLNTIGLNNAGVNTLGFNNVGLNGVNYLGVPDVAAVSGVPITGPFTSTGTAELAVGGEFNAAGSTIIGGQIPVIGAVSFTGQIPASGIVSIAGNCRCNNVPL